MDERIVLVEARKSRFQALNGERMQIPRKEARSGTRCKVRSLGCRSGGGDELVALDLSCNADAAVVRRLDANNLAAAADTDVARTGDLLRQREHEVDFRTWLKTRIGKKIEAAVADIAGLAAQLDGVTVARKDTHGKRHVEATRFAPFRTFSHPPSECSEVGENLSPERKNSQCESAR